MGKVKWFAWVVLGVLVVLLGTDPTSWAAVSSIAELKPSTIKMSSITPLDHPLMDGLKLFKYLVETNTQEKIKVALFPNSQLGAEPAVLEMVRGGSVEMALSGVALTSAYVKEYIATDVMYLIRDYEHFLKVRGGPIQKELDAKMETHGMHVLNSVGLVGTRHILSKKPIRSIGDLQGLKIRTPQAPWAVSGFKALGAFPMAIQFAEIYTALQLGTVDALENPLDWIYAMRFYEVAKNLTLTGHLMGTGGQYVANKKWWEGLPVDARKVIEEAAHTGSLYTNTLMITKEQFFRKKMEDVGVTFIEVDSAPFRKRIDDSIPEMAKAWGGDMGIYEKIKAIK